MGRNNHYIREIFGAHDEAEPRPDQFLRFGKAALVIAGADGELSPKELDYFLGMVRAYGAPDSVIEEFRRFDYRRARIEDFLKAGDEVNGRMLLYDAIRVASSDGTYSRMEQEAAEKMARLAGVDTGTLRSIEALVASELGLKQLRIALLKPNAAVAQA